MDGRSLRVAVLLQREAELRAEREGWEELDRELTARERKARRRRVLAIIRSGEPPTAEALAPPDDGVVAEQCRIGAAYQRIDDELASVARQLVALAGREPQA